MSYQLENHRTRGAIPTCSTTQLTKPECSCQECLRAMLAQVGFTPPPTPMRMAEAA